MLTLQTESYIASIGSRNEAKSHKVLYKQTRISHLSSLYPMFEIKVQ